MIMLTQCCTGSKLGVSGSKLGVSGSKLGVSVCVGWLSLVRNITINLQEDRSDLAGMFLKPSQICPPDLGESANTETDPEFKVTAPEFGVTDPEFGVTDPEFVPSATLC